MFQVKVNSFANRTNWKKYVFYPEHKNKNHDLVIAEEMDKNITLIDNSKEFKNIIKKWTEQQIYKNKNQWKNINRKISTEDLNSKLDNKRILATYTMSENSSFFIKEFNNDENKIITFYQDAMNEWLKETQIPQENVISAIIHFDQSSPHLHISISHFYEKFNKEFNQNFFTVNSKKLNALYQLNLKRITKIQDYQIKRKKILDNAFNSNWNPVEYRFYEKNIFPEHISLYSNITKNLNQKYKNIDQSKMENLRGFKTKDINYNENVLEGKIWTNKLIYSYRKQSILNSYKRFSKTPEFLNLKKRQEFQRKMDFDLNKLNNQYLEIVNYKRNFFKLTKYEIEQVVNKRRYFQRIELDLELLGLSQDLKNQNSIFKNREYNKILAFVEQIKIQKNLNIYTPQDLAFDLWTNNFSKINIENQSELFQIQETFLKKLSKSNFQNFTYYQMDVLKNLSKIKSIIQDFNSWYSLEDIENKNQSINELLGINEKLINSILLTNLVKNDIEINLKPNIKFNDLTMQENNNNNISFVNSKYKKIEKLFIPPLNISYVNPKLFFIDNFNDFNHKMIRKILEEIYQRNPEQAKLIFKKQKT